MRTNLTLSALALASLAAQPLAAMPVSEFLPKAERLKKAGMLAAMTSSDRKPVMNEMKRVSDGFRGRLAKRPKGHALASCPPPKGKAKLKGDEFITYLRAIPANQRNIDMTVAFDRFMAKKYPC